MKPRIFIASSREGLDTAYAAQENLRYEAEVTVWDQGVFEPSKYSLESLASGLDEFDFGVFIFSPDDVATIRNREYSAVRDNVVLELGMFVGRLGKDRCYIVIPDGCEDLRLPTDLLGLTPVLFEPARSDKNLNAALGPACNQIRKKVRQLGCANSSALSLQPVLISDAVSAGHDGDDALSILESWLGSRPHNENTRVLIFSEVDRTLALKHGSAEQYLEIAAQKWGYRVGRKATTTIMFEDRK